MSGVAKTVLVMVISAFVAFIGFAFAANPGDPVATCQGQTMQPGDTCLVIGKHVSETRTMSEQADAQRRTTQGRGWVAGILGTIVCLGSILVLVGTLAGEREKAKEVIRPYLGLRKKMAEENGWTYEVEDTWIGRVLPAGERKGKHEESFTEVVRGELDGIVFEVFDHQYREFPADPEKPLEDRSRTVFLLHHPGIRLDDVKVYPTAVFPSVAARLVLTRGVQDTMKRLGIGGFRIFGGVVVDDLPLVRDHQTEKLPTHLRALRELLDALPETALDRSPR